jgi:hypothetical protein
MAAPLITKQQVRSARLRAISHRAPYGERTELYGQLDALFYFDGHPLKLILSVLPHFTA